MMKGSTLHRSSLTREKMGVLASISRVVDKNKQKVQSINSYQRNTKSKELDLLWGGAQKGIHKIHTAAKTVHHKSPAVYLMIGFIAGVLFMSCIILIVSVSSINPKPEKNRDKAPQEAAAPAGVERLEENSAPAGTTTYTEEKYIIKSGDTINGIAYRYYGKYNEAKIQEIMRINNITNPAGLKIGQELIIPVSQER